MGKDDGGGAMDGELPTLSISLTGVSALNCGKILAPPLPEVIRAVVSRVLNCGCFAYRDVRRCPAHQIDHEQVVLPKPIVDKACCKQRQVM